MSKSLWVRGLDGRLVGGSEDLGEVWKLADVLRLFCGILVAGDN